MECARDAVKAKSPQPCCTDGSQIILTRAEVDWQRRFTPDNALVILHSIELERTVDPVPAAGGVLRCTSPWAVEEDLDRDLLHPPNRTVRQRESHDLPGTPLSRKRPEVSARPLGCRATVALSHIEIKVHAG